MPTANGGYLNVAGYNIPAYERVTSIPDWLPTQGANEQELTDQYRNTNQAFDTSAFDQASGAQQSRVLTTAMNAGNNAAADYANRARQAGGSGMGAGLVKAEAMTGARATAGNMELDRQKFDASQREAAATHATQIATTLGTLRDSYLKSLVQYSTSEDATMADYTYKMAALGPKKKPLVAPLGQLGGTPSSNNGTEFRTYEDYMNYNQHLQDTYGYGG